MRGEFTDEPFEVTIADGNMVCSWPNGPALSMPIRVARENMASCQRALDEWFEQQGGKVVTFRGRPKKTP